MSYNMNIELNKIFIMETDNESIPEGLFGIYNGQIKNIEKIETKVVSYEETEKGFIERETILYKKEYSIDFKIGVPNNKWEGVDKLNGKEILRHSYFNELEESDIQKLEVQEGKFAKAKDTKATWYCDSKGWSKNIVKKSKK